jgi:carbonic anhydrase
MVPVSSQGKREMQKYNRIFDNNKKWVAEQKARDPEYFAKLSSGQKPAFLYIGCADSRVPANEITGTEPGDIFVHRNIANIVVNTDLNAHSVLEYAVNHLEVEHILVVGHYGCGGVRAAMQSADLGILNGWLREIRDVYRPHREELRAIANEEARYRRLVELNVQEQCIHVMKTASVQKQFLKRRHPTVHGLVFDLSDGVLHDLKIPFESILSDIREIYRLDV